MKFLGRIPDILIYFAAVSLLYSYARRNATEADASRPLELGLGKPLADERPTDPSIVVTLNDPSDGIGTAFAVDRSGSFLTARHVVDGCERIVLHAGGRQAVEARGFQPGDNADTAVIQTGWTREPLAQDLYSQRYVGEPGYFMGFPQGRGGEAAGRLLGRQRMIVRGRFRTNEPVLAWAETGRSQGLFGSLGGLSGGPVLDSDGEVIGLVTAESPRRGRIYTVAPTQLQQMFPQTARIPAHSPVTNNSYDKEADKLRSARRIVQVFCVVD